MTFSLIPQHHAIGRKARLLLDGHVYRQPPKSRHKKGFAGAEAMSFGGTSFLTGIGLGTVGLGVVFGNLLPSLGLVVGGVAVISIGKYCANRTSKLTQWIKARNNDEPRCD